MNKPTVSQSGRFALPRQFKDLIILLHRCPVKLLDSLFLGTILVLSMVLYIGNIGFYSDDWGFLQRFSAPADQSLWGVFSEVYRLDPNLWMRPVQVIYLAILYKLFGLQPFGSHVVNGVVFVAGIVLFYLSLRLFLQNRSLALAIALLYGLLPHYSTNRFWFAVFQGNLSMTFYFLSLYADLKTVRTKPGQVWGWKALSVVSLLVSTFAYECFLPLFAIHPLLVYYCKRQVERSTEEGRSPVTPLSRLQWTILLLSNLVLLAVIVLVKMRITVRPDKYEFFDQVIWFAKFLAGYGAISFGDYGFGLPQILSKIFFSYANLSILLLSGIVTLGVWTYFTFITNQSATDLTQRRKMLVLVVSGFMVYFLGYAVFFSARAVGISATGSNNRVAIAAAAGVALVFVGVVGWVSSLAASFTWRQRFFSILVAFLCGSGFLINNTIATFWVTASQQNQAILADIRQNIPALPPASTLLVDGICPYVGPGIVFESFWDLKGAVQMIYRDPSLQAHPVVRTMQIKEDGISFDDNFGTVYPYTHLFVYNFDRKTLQPLTNATSANQYFQTFNPDYGSGCPVSKGGHGEKIFDSLLDMDFVRRIRGES